MSNFEFKLDRDGVKELMQSPAMQQAVEKMAEERAQRVPGDWKVETSVGSTRARATISADSVDSYYDNLDNNLLLKAVK